MQAIPNAFQRFSTPITLPVGTYWDGKPCPDSQLQGQVQLFPTEEGLEVTARLPHQSAPRIPYAPAGTRVHGLWQYDVVELFLSGPDGYTELELGPGGHFLLLRFSAPRFLSDACEFLQLPLYLTPLEADGRSWSCRTLVPWSVLPSDVERLNAYVIVGTHFLCWAPLPGEKPDFHQPQRFPLLSSLS